MIKYMAKADIPTGKRIIFSPNNLNGNLSVSAFYLPKLENLPLILKPFVVNMAVSMLMSQGRNMQEKKK